MSRVVVLSVVIIVGVSCFASGLVLGLLLAVLAISREKRNKRQDY